MGAKKQDFKKVLNREAIFKYIAANPGDLETVKIKLLKNKISLSRIKINDAISELQASGRIQIQGKQVFVNPNTIKKGKFYTDGHRHYVVFPGDSHEYQIDNENAKNYKNFEKVNVSFLLKLDRNGNEYPSPYIVSRNTEKENKQDVVFEEQEDIFSPKEEILYGRVIKINQDNLVFLANNKAKYKEPITIANDKKVQSKFQDKICTLRIMVQPNGDTPAIGEVLEVKGDAGNPISEYDAIAESHGAIMSWSDEAVQKEIARAPQEVDMSKLTLIKEGDPVGSSKDKTKDEVVDLRDLMFTTVDPATCKDMDDAIYSTFDEDGNYVTYTAVANVTKYIKQNSEIAKRYFSAGFTTYAPNKAYNILPPEYSTTICSLNPNEDRRALVVKTVIDKKTGFPIESSIMDALIQSKEKYSYEQAQKIWDDNPQMTPDYLREKLQSGEKLTKDEQVVMNAQSHLAIAKGFERRNKLNFNSQDEYKVKFNEDFSDIVDIVPDVDLPYNDVIADFMITANEAMAEFALKNNIPNIYRVHAAPREDQSDRASEFFGYLDVPFFDDLSPTGIKSIIESVKGTNKEKIVNDFLIRLQTKAKYSTSVNPEASGYISISQMKKHPKYGSDSTFERDRPNGILDLDDPTQKISHFGLQSQHYSHSTAPIRRITDYFTHYNILAYIKGEKMLSPSVMENAVHIANNMQDHNDQAEREIKQVNSAIYCEHHINEPMKGNICSFRRTTEDKNYTIDDIYVVVENQQKGIRVNIPLADVFNHLNIHKKNIGISQSGCAIINKATNKPIITLCSEIPFKILASNRCTREIHATCDMEKDPKTFDILHGDGTIEHENYAMSEMDEKRFKEEAYQKKHNQDMERRSGKPGHKRYAGDYDKKARAEEKRDNVKYKHHKQNMEATSKIEEYNSVEEDDIENN